MQFDEITKRILVKVINLWYTKRNILCCGYGPPGAPPPVIGVLFLNFCGANGSTASLISFKNFMKSNGEVMKCLNN